jgi:hypothetical protein
MGDFEAVLTRNAGRRYSSGPFLTSVRWGGLFVGLCIGQSLRFLDGELSSLIPILPTLTLPVLAA